MENDKISLVFKKTVEENYDVPITVVKSSSDFFVLDGHHRAFIRKKLLYRTIQAHVLLFPEGKSYRKITKRPLEDLRIKDITPIEDPILKAWQRILFVCEHYEAIYNTPFYLDRKRVRLEQLVPTQPHVGKTQVEAIKKLQVPIVWVCQRDKFYILDGHARACLTSSRMQIRISARLEDTYLEHIFMSGTETLLPYLKEKKVSEKEEPTIIVDCREANTAAKIVKGLTERGANVKTETLEKGDYILSDQCAVERKTVHDFVYTLTRRFLFEQLFKLKEVYPKSLILLEGYLPVIYKYSRIQPSSVWGAMFNLAKNGIAIINTSSYKETIDFLYIAARQEQIVEKRTPTVHPCKRVDTTADAQIYLIASLPSVGREKALAILKSYQTPLNALANVDDWPETVHGLGPKISGKVKDVLTTPFTE